MTNSRVFSRQALLAATATFVLAAPAAAQITTPDREIGSVTVTDTAIEESEAQSGYKVSRSTQAMRTDTPLVDVPQSVSVITVRQIEDQAANSIGDAIRYTPGVFSAQGEGNRETLILRGNSTTGDFFVDGIRDDVQTYRDLYNIETLEIFKGPNAMIFGRGGIGGVINRVTKVADWTMHRAFRLEGGSFEHKRAQFDLGTPIGEVAAVRVTGVYQDSNSYRDGVNYNRWGVNPTATFKLGAATTITAGYEHFQDDRIADRGVSTFAGRPLNTPRGQFFGNAQQSPTWTNTDAATLYIEHEFSDAVTLRNRTRYADYDKFYQNVFPGATNTAAETITAATTTRPGLAPGSYAPGTFVQIAAYNNLTNRENVINQTDLNAEFDTGGITHTVLAGFEYGRQITDNVRLEGRFQVPGFPTTQAAVFTPVTQSVVNYPIDWVAIASSGNNRGTATVVAGYVQDQIELSPMVQIVAGVRYEHFNTKVHDRRSLAFRTSGTTVSPERFDVTNDLWSPRAGLIFKPAENASIYASYSRTYLPRGGDQLTALSLSNANLDPEKYDNYEIGAKWDVVPTFNLAAAVFQLDRTNVLALSDPNNAASQQVPSGRQRTRGVELSAQGSITTQLSVVGAYTYTKAEFLDTLPGAVAKGNLVANVPEHAASLWTRYDPIERVGAAIGVIHQGKRFAGTDNTVSMPGYTRVDGALYVRVSDALDLQVNVENILGERYFLYAHSNTNITPGSPAAFKAGLNARF